MESVLSDPDRVASVDLENLALHATVLGRKKTLISRRACCFLDGTKWMRWFFEEEDQDLASLEAGARAFFFLRKTFSIIFCAAG